ncbi:MAG: EAL domain-containing protein [Bdellovibrionales bacterium]
MERVVQVSSGAVLEQDFILQIRRLQKQGEAAWVLNIMFTQMPNLNSHPELLDSVHDHLNDFARKASGSLHLMTNGDGFLILPGRVTKDPSNYAAAILQAILPQGFDPGRSPVALTQIFAMPDDYMPLRERINYYIGIAKDLEENVADDPERNLQSDAVQGPLTAYALSEIERLLESLDIRRYHRAQRVYEKQTDGSFKTYYEENFISTTELQQDKFPRLDLRGSGRLFAELSSQMDRRMLAHLLRVTDQWQGRSIGLNLSARTVLSSTFAQFCHVVVGAARQHVTFEIHISDLFHDLPTFENALTTLRNEGFRVVIDGLRPDMLPLLRLEALSVEGYKISVRKDMLPFINQPLVLQAVRQLLPAKVIFMHCETQQAMDIGAALGITHFQGFYIDDLTKGK